MISNIDIQQFFLLFKGNTSFYNRNSLPKERPEGGKFKTNIVTVKEKLTKDIVAEHLEGIQGIGFCPITNDNKVSCVVLDVDCYDNRLEKVLDIIREYDFPFIPFRSKSGGLHCYVFFSKAVSAHSARALLEDFIKIFSLEDIFGKGKVEIFPKQETLKADGAGSCICLPYFNADNTYNGMIDCFGNEIEFKEALSFIPKHMTTVEAFKERLENLPYNDCPPCLQKMLLSHLVGDEDSGRNNFLFSFAVYCKKKYGADFEDYVKGVNNDFSSPLEENAVIQLCESVRNNEYYYKCKELSSYCNKGVCRKREYGLGTNDKGKSHFTGVEFGTLTRVMTSEPYYKWQLRIKGNETWKECIFKNEGYLLDQKNFQQVCLRYLNYAPMQVSTNDWNNTLNLYLPQIQEEEVKKESDTSGTNMIRNAFLDYLSNKQARRDSPYQIRVGLCVRQVQNGVVKYYFTHNGFLEYLRTKKINFDYNMLRETLKMFGAKEDTLIYTNAQDEIKNFPCWSKTDDDELEETYQGNKEIEEGDKNNLGMVSVSEASAVSKNEVPAEEKPYTESDLKDAEDLF